jgi:PPOX class probable F420-dependent enzyme
MRTPLPPAVRKLLEGANIAHVATLMKDGSPQVTAVWVDVEGDRILINTAEHRAKPRNVRRDPRVAISIADARQPEIAAFIRGRVVEITADGADAHIDRLSQKYRGASFPRVPGQQRIILAIEADHISGQGIG